MVVVGAGITGLTAAWALAHRGHDVVVLERSFGSGATARSGGIVLGETLVGPVPEFDGCEDELSQWISEHEVACGLEWSGCLELARNSDLPRAPIDWQDSGGVRVLQVVNGGMLDPSRLLTGLAKATWEAGAQIVDETAVARLSVSRGSVVFTTSRGDIAARTGLMAVDAWSRTDRSDPFPERMLTFSLETAPVPNQTLLELGLCPRRPFYTQELPLLWGRPTPRGSLIFGRETASLDSVARSMAEAGDRLTKRVRSLHPTLSQVEVARVWGGPIGRNESGVPSCRRDPSIAGLWWAGGYGGHGLAQAFRLGVKAAQDLVSH